MSDFIRRMQSSSVIFRSPDDGGTPTPDPAVSNAGGEPPDPAGGTTSPDTGTAGDGSPSDGGTPPETPPADGGTPPAAVQPAQPDRAQQRMNQLVAERWNERRQREAAEAQNRLLQEQLNQARTAVQQPAVDADGNPVQQPQPTRPAQPQPDLQRMAADIAAQNEFNRQVGDEVAKGRGAHTDFDQVASNLQRFGELPRTFVEAALATGKGADVMYALGSDIAEADRILSLPPIQQAVALATLAQGIKAPEPPKKVTSAPDPVTPRVGGGSARNTPSLDDPNIPVADFIAMREKQIAASKSAGNRSRR